MASQAVSPLDVMDVELLISPFQKYTSHTACWIRRGKKTMQVSSKEFSSVELLHIITSNEGALHNTRAANNDRLSDVGCRQICSTRRAEGPTRGTRYTSGSYGTQTPRARPQEDRFVRLSEPRCSQSTLQQPRWPADTQPEYAREGAYKLTTCMSWLILTHAYTVIPAATQLGITVGALKSHWEKNTPFD